MSPTRRERIEDMLAEDPTDEFLRYSLAMEFDKEGRHEESLARLRELIEQEQPYVPAFFMAGQQLARLQRVEESRTVLTAGVDAAEIQGDAHAAGEMREFIAGLGVH